MPRCRGSRRAQPPTPPDPTLLRCFLMLHFPSGWPSTADCQEHLRLELDMELGDMASLQDGAWAKTQAGAHHTRSSPRNCSVFPRMLDWTAASLYREVQKSFGNLFTAMWNRNVHAEFYLCLGRHVLHDCTQGCGWFSNKAEQRQGFVICSPSPPAFTPPTNPHLSLVWPWCQLTGLSLLLSRGKGMEMKIYPYAARWT